MKLPSYLAVCLLFVCWANLHAQSYSFSSYASLGYSPASSQGIAIDSTGVCYLGCGTGVLKVTTLGMVGVFAGSGTYATGYVDGISTAARFGSIGGIAIDATGNLYVADAGNHVIRKITPGGVVSTWAGTAGSPGGTDGLAGSASFNAPTGLVFDSTGTLYVCDTGNHTIRKISPLGVVTTLAGMATKAGSADGTGTAASFNRPQGIAVDPAKQVWVADTDNHTIRKISPNGVVSTLAGLAGSAGSDDGDGGYARFNSPQGVAVDAAGNLYVCDRSNRLIRRVFPTGRVITIAGSTSAYGLENGLGAAARFYSPYTIAITSAGNLMVGDSSYLRNGVPSGQAAITVQPQNISIASGSTLRLSASVTGEGAISYQWSKDGSIIPGATLSTLIVPSVDVSHAGTYTLRTYNAINSVVGSAATVTVLSALSNNDFAKAQAIAGPEGSVVGTTSGATSEPGEPTHFSAVATASSVWYCWTAPQAGTAVFRITSTTSTFAVGAYTGDTVATLKRIAAAGYSTVSFPAVVGGKYWIAVGSASLPQGSFSLGWSLLTNDSFSGAQLLSGDSGQLTIDSRGATLEEGEPDHGLGMGLVSLWYRWTPSRAGVCVLRFSQTVTSTPRVPYSADACFVVYTGTSLKSLTRVATGTGVDKVAFSVYPGNNYWIAVLSPTYAQAATPLCWELALKPVIAGPMEAGTRTVTAGERVSFSVNPLSLSPVTYQWWRNGAAIPGATRSTLEFSAARGEDAGTYAVEVSNSFGSVFGEGITLVVRVPPANDNFANAEVLTGWSGTVTGSNINASGEEGEPTHWSMIGTSSSVWYKWTAPSNGLVVIDTAGSTLDTVLAVYTGSSLGSLTRLVQNDNASNGSMSLVSFGATVATSYYIAVGTGGYGRTGASFRLNWQLSAVLAITVQPTNQTVAVGSSAEFRVSASGQDVSYQWY